MNKLMLYFEFFFKECKFIIVKNLDVINIKIVLFFIFILIYILCLDQMIFGGDMLYEFFNMIDFWQFVNKIIVELKESLFLFNKLWFVV